MAVPNLGDLVATTLAKWDTKLFDTITTEHALLNTMAKKGNVAVTANGREIYEPVIYGENSSQKWYSGYEIFTPPTDQNAIDVASYQWKQQGSFISISGLEAIQNSGESQMIAFAEGRTKQAMANLKNTAGEAMFSTGTGSGGKEIGGLQSLVADNPAAAGTVGGIDQVANTWWRNAFNTSVTGSAGAAIQLALVTAMNTMWRQVTVGTEKPDLIVMDDVGFGIYEASLQDQVRFTQTNKADAGFGELAYKQSAVVFDAYCPLRHVYMLNTDTLFLRAAPGRMWNRDEKRKIQNADYDVIPIWFMGNLVTGNRKRNGVISFTVS